MNKKHVLVTGGAGFIGRYVVEALLSSGYEVTIYDNFSASNPESVPSKARVIEGDMLDKDKLAAALDGVDEVVHLAAQVSVPYSVDFPAESDQSNILGLTVLFKQLSELNFKGKVVYASSAAVYGNKEVGDISREGDPFMPNSPYALEKCVNEQQAKLAFRLWGINSLGLRFFNVFGEGQDVTSSYAGVISVFIDKIKKNKALTIYGDGKQVRDFIYVKDVARLVLESVKKDITGSQISNIGTGVDTNVLDLASLLMDLLGNSPQVISQAKREGDVLYSRACIKNQCQTFSHQPLSLRDGLRDWLKV